jgi:hypothetical protein
VRHPPQLVDGRAREQHRRHAVDHQHLRPLAAPEAVPAAVVPRERSVVRVPSEGPIEPVRTEGVSALAVMEPVAQDVEVSALVSKDPALILPRFSSTWCPNAMRKSIDNSPRVLGLIRPGRHRPDPREGLVPGRRCSDRHLVLIAPRLRVLVAVR